MAESENINEVLKYKNVLQQTNYNNLINKMDKHEISKIYFTNTLDNAITENDNTEGDILTDYSATTINPFIVKPLIDKAIENKVETYFLQPPQYTGFDIIARNIGGFFEGYVFPFLFISFIIIKFY